MKTSDILKQVTIGEVRQIWHACAWHYGTVSNFYVVCGHITGVLIKIPVTGRYREIVVHLDYFKILTKKIPQAEKKGVVA